MTRATKLRTDLGKFAAILSAPTAADAMFIRFTISPYDLKMVV